MSPVCWLGSHILMGAVGWAPWLPRFSWPGILDWVRTGLTTSSRSMTAHLLQCLGWAAWQAPKPDYSPWLETPNQMTPQPDTATSSALQMGRSTLAGISVEEPLQVGGGLPRSWQWHACKLYPFCISYLILKEFEAADSVISEIGFLQLLGKLDVHLSSLYWLESPGPRGASACIHWADYGGDTAGIATSSDISEALLMTLRSKVLQLYLGSGVLPVVACLWIVASLVFCEE